jgi:triosephosphate isomerase
MLWIGTSWKMNKLRADSREYANSFISQISDLDLRGIQPFILPPVTSLDILVDLLGEGTNILLGVQNAHWAESGAWTGEISMSMVADAGASLIEIGHAERRANFGETDRVVNLKVKSALANGLRPIVCVGEPEKVFEAGGATEYVLEQLWGAFEGVEDFSSVLIAYEPVWAIGDLGRAPAPEDVAAVLAALQMAVGAGQSDPSKRTQAVLLGGSLNPQNATAFLDLPGTDGLFIGRAARTADGFAEILRRVVGRISTTKEYV